MADHYDAIKTEPNVAYHSVSAMDSGDSNHSVEERPRIELGGHPQLSQQRTVLTTLFVQICSLLWLAPIGVLLWLNFSTYIIGPTAWCPSRNCTVELFNPVATVPQQKLIEFDKEDHNLNGGLQLVAKVLEVWFVFISAALVYLVTMNFASKHEGLPVGYLTRPIEFADPVTLVDPLLYKTGPHLWGKRSRGDQILGRRVWFLILLSVGLCILCNLMGPATAVLVIPTLQWLDTKTVGDRQFIELNGAAPPKVDESAWFWWATADCSDEQLANQEYTCTYNNFGAALDQWAANTNNGMQMSSQYGLTFMTNSTGKSSGRNVYDLSVEDVFYWAPSRQIISNMSTDYDIVKSLSQGYTVDYTQNYSDTNNWNADPVESYVEFNKGRELSIQRNGPINGAVVNMWYNFNDSSNLVTISVDADRQIRCYHWYDLWYTPLEQGTSTGNYTKCMQVGSGWGAGNKQAFFGVNGKYDESFSDRLSPGVEVRVYSSEKVTYFPNGTLPSWLPPVCLTNDTRINETRCDWDRLWSVDKDSEMYNRSSNVNTIEYLTYLGDTSTNFVVDFAPFLAFTNYTMDPSPFTNPLKFVKNTELPTDPGQSIHIDPSWVLAAWAADKDQWLPSNRTMTSMLLESMLKLQANQTADALAGASDDIDIEYTALLPVMQTLSLVDHSTKFITDKVKTVDAQHPILQRYGKINVWAFKMGSRTSHLGAAVGILGCVVVIAQVILGFTDRRRYRSPTQLLVAALEHAPRGEFEGRNHDEVAMASVKFHIRDDGHHTGKFSFYEPVEHIVESPHEKTVR